MPAHLQAIVAAAIVGAGLMSGLLLAFSIVVMRALAQLPAEFGMLAMQRINVLIVRPLFLLLFLGTSVLCLAIAVVGVRGAASPGALWLLCGAGAYLLGPLGVTVAFNVPLNHRLAALAPADAAAHWQRYVSTWLRWNHLRTALGVLSTVCLTVGLVRALQNA